jgi:protein-disulfide isomerase
VYYTRPAAQIRPLLVLLATALAMSLCARGVSAQTGAPLTIDPSMTRGPADAPVTIVEFSDYECPACRQAQQALGLVLREFPGRVRLVYKDFPLRFHAGAEPAAVAARCAAEHGRFWEYHDFLFLTQPAFARADLLTYATRLGLPRDAFIACLDGGRYRPAVSVDVREGRAAGVTGTPTFFVNGRRMVGIQSIEMFREAVQDALEDAGVKSP